MPDSGAGGVPEPFSVAEEPGSGVVRERASPGADGGEGGSELDPVRGEPVPVSGRRDDVSERSGRVH